MLDLKELEKEIDCFIANQTKETYNELFKSLDEEEIVKLSGGYTFEYDCPTDIVINKPNAMESGNSDFSGNGFNMAA